MGIIHHEAGAMTTADFGQLRQGRELSVHAEHTVCHNQLPLNTRLRRVSEEPFQVRHVVVGKDFVALCPRFSAALVNAGVSMLVAKDCVAASKQSS